MSRRRSRQPSISLFSFQDIVTSVTAILILVVLILTLELISQKYQDSATDSTATATMVAESVAQLEAFVKRLETERRPKDLASVLASPPATADRDLRILREQLDRAKLQVFDAHRINNDARRLADAAVADLRRRESLQGEMLEQERDAKDLAAETAQIDSRNTTTRAELETRKKELESTPQAETELVFKRPQDTSRQPWLLEVSDSGFVTLRLGSGQADPLGADETQPRFRDWVARLRPNSDYVLILVRPSGIDAARIVMEKLRDRGIRYGTDFIGEGQTVHDGSAPANQPGETGEQNK